MIHRIKLSAAEDNPLWLIVLCDMMTNLMLFFLIMFAYNLQDEKKQEEFARTFATGEVLDIEGNPAVREELPPDPAEILMRLIEENKLGGAVELIETEESIRLRLKSEILFKSGEAEMSPDSIAAMTPLAALLAQLDNTIIIEGHTDSIPIRSGPFKSNWELSISRSHAIIQSLAAGGVAPARLVAAGYGEFHPVTDNNTPEHRAKNRRVEIVLLRAKEDS